MCPTSNREVVGFRDPLFPATAACPVHPLADLRNAGVAVAVCTDNPGISRTTLADEFIATSRMALAGLSHWSAMSMARQSFVSSFADAHTRSALLRRAEGVVFARASSPPTPASLRDRPASP
jgi:adenosine deaminase